MMGWPRLRRGRPDTFEQQNVTHFALSILYGVTCQGKATEQAFSCLKLFIGSRGKTFALNQPRGARKAHGGILVLGGLWPTDLLEQIRDGVFVLDNTLVLTFFNTAAEAALGRARSVERAMAAGRKA